MDENLKKRIEKLITEEIAIAPYNPIWSKMFRAEVEFLKDKLPKMLIKRIEHFGSTAIPGMSAKPIIDILVEVASLEETKKFIVPILEAEGYEYFWRPTQGDQPPFYAWFIKRDANGSRSHHLHMVEGDSELWDRLYFRDYLIEFPHHAKQYEILKKHLSEKYPNDRVKYTEEKTEFIVSVTQTAKLHYCA